MERYGIAGFGWGATWLGDDGELQSHRDTRAFRDDPARDAVGATETTALLVHLRRPSRLSTLQLPDTQPFVDPAGRFAFSHNGELARWQGARAAYRTRAASRAAPTARSGSAGSRTPGPRTPAAGAPPRSTAGSAGSRTSRSSAGTAPATTTRATRRTRCSRSASAGSASRRRRSTPSTGPCSGTPRRAPHDAGWRVPRRPSRSTTRGEPGLATAEVGQTA